MKDLKPTNDTATGRLKLTGSEYTVRLRKVDGRWFMALSEETVGLIKQVRQRKEGGARPVSLAPPKQDADGEWEEF